MLNKNFNKIFKLHFVDKKYIVNKEAGTVVCIIKVRLRRMDRNRWYDACLHEFFNSDYNEFAFVGVAKCHKDDTFDEQKGKYIAESKAKCKMYSIVETQLKKSFDKLRSLTDDIVAHINLYNAYKDRELAHIDDVAHR